MGTKLILATQTITVTEYYDINTQIKYSILYEVYTICICLNSQLVLMNTYVHNAAG